MKRCSMCDTVKPLAEFSRDRTKRDGRECRCKVCSRAKGRRYYAANAEAVKVRQAEWRETNRGYLNARAHAYRATPQAREAVRRYKRAHPEKYRAYESRRRSRQRAGDVVDPALIALLGQPCAYCGSTEHIEIDHIVPLTRGGKHEPENLAPACRSCNRSKGAKFVSEWLGEVV